MALHGVSTIIDIRSDRHDATAPDFGPAAVEAHTAEAGFGYRWIGRVCGAHSDADVDAVLEQLNAVAAVTNSVILCREPDPSRCNRSIVLAPALRERGTGVLHILQDGSARPHEPPLPFDR